MTTKTPAAAALAAAIIVACGTADDRPGPPGVGGNGAGTAGAAAGRSGAPSTSGGTSTEGGATTGDGGTGDGAAGSAGAHVGEAGAAGAGHGGEGGTGWDFPCPSDEADEPPDFATHCDPAARFEVGESVAVEAGNAASLIAVTPDELSIAWSRLGSFSLLFFVADRSSRDDSFDSPNPITVDEGSEVVGMSPDGLRVLLLSDEKTRYSQMTREALGHTFADIDEAAFETLNTEAAENELSYWGGVLSADDRSLVYLAFSGNEEDDRYPVRISVRSDNEPWPVGEPLRLCELQAHGELVRRPSGISSDGLTLFFFDPDRSAARAAFRETPNAAFSWFTTYPGIGAAAPNDACDRLYFSGARQAAPLRIADVQ